MITPIKDFILLELPENSESRIVLPDNRNVNAVDIASLVVIKVGKECKTVKVGDKLVVDAQALAHIKVDNRQYFVTREDNVACVIR